MCSSDLGDKHNYVSWGPYWWPPDANPPSVPGTTSLCQYVNHDGIHNPNIDMITDRHALHATSETLFELALAWYFTGNTRYADQAELVARTFFLNPDTAMNPNMDYAQQHGPCGPGNAAGLIEATGGYMTDALDGILARQTARCTRMGQMLDPMTDACFYSTMTSVAVRRGTLPWWGSWLLAVRFLAPVAAGAYRYFVWARPVDAAHTMWGKLSSVALITTIGVSAISIRAGRFCWWPTSLLVATAGALQLRRILPPGMQALDAPRHDLARLEKRLGNRSR